MAAKDLRKIVRELETQGFAVSATAKGHWVVKRDDARVTTFSGSPSDTRGVLNALAHCKRAGFIWPAPKK